MIKCNVIADVADMRGKSVLVFLRPERPARDIRIHAWQVLDISSGAIASFDFDTTISATISTNDATTGNQISSAPAIIPPGFLFQTTRPGGLSPLLEPASDGMALARLTPTQSGVYNIAVPPKPIGCCWRVGGSPVATMPDVDWGMTCSFEYKPTLYFQIAAPLIGGEHFNVQAFTDAVPYDVSPDTAVLNVHIRRQRNRWIFDFQPDWGEN